MCVCCAASFGNHCTTAAWTFFSTYALGCTAPWIFSRTLMPWASTACLVFCTHIVGPFFTWTSTSEYTCIFVYINTYILPTNRNTPTSDGIHRCINNTRSITTCGTASALSLVQYLPPKKIYCLPLLPNFMIYPARDRPLCPSMLLTLSILIVPSVCCLAGQHSVRMFQLNVLMGCLFNNGVFISLCAPLP